MRGGRRTNVPVMRSILDRLSALVGGGRTPAADESSMPHDGREAHVKLIVGLGNPGERYRQTRHNAGFLVLDELARRHDVKFRKVREAESCKFRDALLLKPITYMNASGRAVQAAMASSRARPEQVLLVHDDLDLPLGRLRFKRGGGAGGQRGVRDTISRIGPDFWRLKVGISRPPEGWQVENWVLSRFREEEQELVERVVTAAADSLEALLTSDYEAVMNRANGLDLAADGTSKGAPGSR